MPLALPRVQAAILTLIIGSLFATLEPTTADSRQVMSLSSLSVMNMAMFSMPQVGIVFANKRCGRACTACRTGSWPTQTSGSFFSTSTLWRNCCGLAAAGFLRS